MALVLAEPPLFTAYAVRRAEPVELFRIVRSDDPSADAFLACFVSNFQSGKPPRGPENRSTAIQMGLSMYERSTQAEQTARLFPVIGRYVARLTMRADRGFTLASTGQAGHWTVWGHPQQFVDSVADIYPW